LYQGTTLVVPQMRQNKDWALAPEGMKEIAKQKKENAQNEGLAGWLTAGNIQPCNNS
jgi:hypothetical protein